MKFDQMCEKIKLDENYIDFGNKNGLYNRKSNKFEKIELSKNGV